MGGDALKTVECRRHDKAEYKAIEREVLRILLYYFDAVQVYPYFESKPDFGDLDVMIGLDSQIRELPLALLAEAGDEGSKETIRHAILDEIMATVPSDVDLDVTGFAWDIPVWAVLFFPVYRYASIPSIPLYR